MSEELKPTYQDDEIDLFELIETVWKEKVLIILFTFVAAMGGAGYAFLATPKYSVSVNYIVNPKMPASDASDASDVANRLFAQLPVGWGKEKKSNAAVLTTLAPESVTQYANLFSELERSISKELLSEAKSNVEIIINDLPETLQSTEAVAQQMLQSKQTIRALSDGGKSIVFSTPVISQTAPKKALILALSVVLGGMVGVMFVLIRSAVLNRKAKT